LARAPPKVRVLGFSRAVSRVNSYLAQGEGARGKWNFGFDESKDSFPPTWHHRRTFSISLPPIETMRVLSFLLLAAPCLVSCFTLNTRKNQPTVVQRAIQSKWTMMPEEPQPEVSAILIIATQCHFHVSPKSFSRISSRLHFIRSILVERIQMRRLLLLLSACL
jgi:hypothetical protein